jgi:hypothetical protein
MQPKMHAYHLDDAPDLRSCNLFFRAHPDRQPAQRSYALHGSRLEDFYGKNQNLRVQYVMEKERVDYGKAPSETYTLQILENK